MRYTTIKGGVVKPRMSIAGYIKVGGKEKRPRWGRSGPYLLPTRYVNPTRFEVTTREHVVEEVSHPQRSRKYKLDRGYRRDEAIHQIVGKSPAELNVRLYFEKPEENFVSFLGWYDGRKWACTGNGVEATEVGPKGDVQRNCPCDRLGGKDPQAGICKPQGSLSVWLEDSGQWGLAHMFKTTSWESIGNISTQLHAFYQSFGTLAWLPLTLKVYPATKRFMQGDSMRTTTQPIVTLAVRGNPMQALDVAQTWDKSREIAASIGSPDEHLALVKAELAEEATAHGEEFFPETRPPKDAPPPRRAASRLAKAAGDDE